RGSAVVLHAGPAPQRIELSDRRSIMSVVLSPDGKWAATTAWKDHTVKVWKADTGELARLLPGRDPNYHVPSAAFSPGNQWLVTGGLKEFRWWRVGSWEPGPKIARSRQEPGDAPLAFARDVPLLAITPTAQTVQLVDPASGRELATLTAPDRHIISWLCFSP